MHQIELEMQNEELRKSQLALEEACSKYQDLYDFSPAGYFTITREAIIVEANLTSASLLGVPRQKLIRQRFRRFVAEHDLESWDRHITAAFQQAEKLTCVLELKRADGTTLHARLESVRKESGGAEVVRTVMMDVSERVRAEKKLLDSEHTPAPVLRIRHDRRYLLEHGWSDNRCKRKIPGRCSATPGMTLRPAESTGSTMTPPEYRHIDDFSVAELKATGVNRSPLEKEYIRKDGTRIPVILSGAMLDEARTHGVAYVLDNTERKRAEKSLKESEEKYRLIVENTGDNITVLDMNFRITYTSPSITKLRGYSVEEVMAQTLDQIFLPESLKKIGEVVAEQMALEAEGTADPQRRAIIELEEYCKDGSRIWVEDVFTFIRDDSGRPTGILSVSRDITDRKRLEMEIQKSESRFRGYFDIPLHGIAVTSPEKGWLQVNDRLCAMLGYERDEILRKTWAEMTHPDDLDADMEQFNRILSGEINQYTLVKRFMRKDGQIIWTSLAAGCVREPDGSVDYMIALLDDITDQKRAEDALQINNDELVRVTAQLRQTLEGQDRARLVLLSILEDEKITRLALRESEEKHRTLFETMAQGVVYQDAAGAIMTANPAAQRILGLTLDQMMGRTSFDPRWKAVHEDGSDYPGDGHPAMKALKTGDEVRDEIMGVLNPELNTFRWISINAIPRFRQGEDRPYQVYTTFTDITELKLAEQQARYQLQFLYIVINAIKAPIFFKDTEGRYSGCNAAFEEYVGHPLSELIGKTVFDLWPRELADHYHRKDLELLEKGGDQTYETRAQFTDGTHRDVMYHKSLYHGRNGSIGGIVGVMLDITDRKKAEQALRESEERLRVAMEATQIGIWDWDLKNDIWQTTPIYYTMLGYEPVEGPSDRTVWLDRVHPEDRAMVEESIKTVLQQKLTEYQYEARLRHADGSYRWVNVQGSIVEKDADGNPTRILGIRMDVTDRKRAEEAVHESERFAQSTVNALEANIAILDGIGDIISVNRSWREFAYENSEDPIRVFEGVNYLAVCDEASGEQIRGGGRICRRDTERHYRRQGIVFPGISLPFAFIRALVRRKGHAFSRGGPSSGSWCRTTISRNESAQRKKYPPHCTKRRCSSGRSITASRTTCRSSRA